METMSVEVCKEAIAFFKQKLTECENSTISKGTLLKGDCDGEFFCVTAFGRDTFNSIHVSGFRINPAQRTITRSLMNYPDFEAFQKDVVKDISVESLIQEVQGRLWESFKDNDSIYITVDAINLFTKRTTILLPGYRTSNNKFEDIIAIEFDDNFVGEYAWYKSGEIFDECVRKISPDEVTKLIGDAVTKLTGKSIPFPY